MRKQVARANVAATEALLLSRAQVLPLGEEAWRKACPVRRPNKGARCLLYSQLLPFFFFFGGVGREPPTKIDVVKKIEYPEALYWRT